MYPSARDMLVMSPDALKAGMAVPYSIRTVKNWCRPGADITRAPRGKRERPDDLTRQPRDPPERGRQQDVRVREARSRIPRHAKDEVSADASERRRFAGFHGHPVKEHFTFRGNDIEDQIALSH